MLDKCPKCGNPLSKDTSRCSFCGAEAPTIPPSSRGAISSGEERLAGKSKRNKDKIRDKKRSDKNPYGWLCPFCGSSDIQFNERYKSWRCNKCEKSFPSPSKGPGKDMGLEARWFGKTTDELSRTDAEFKKAVYPENRKAVYTEPVRDGESREQELGKEPEEQEDSAGFSIKEYKAYPARPPIIKVILNDIERAIPLMLRKLILCWLAICFTGAMIYSGYYLFTHEIAPVTGSVIFILEGAILVWAAMMLRRTKYRRAKPSFKLVVSIVFIILIVITFAGVEPMSSYKDDLFSWIAEKIRTWTTAE